MKHASRIIIMVMATELLILSILGFKNSSIDIVAAVILIATIPVSILVSILHIIERLFNGSPKYIIALIGLFPLLFFIFASLFLQIKGFGNRYSMEIVLTGFIWSAAWIYSSDITNS